MRVKSSIINISVGVGNQLVITLLSFFSRTVFINTLGVQLLGVNGLFTNILAMLSLAEVGIGSSIIYSLYKPVADNDQEEIKMLMKLYKQAYTVIAFLVLLLGLSVVPFLPYFIKDSSIENIHFIYTIFLINTVIPYFFSYKINLLNVYQKSYIVTAIYSVSSILSTCLKIGILYSTQNYIFYLVIDCFITIVNSILLYFIVGKMYPFLKDKVSGKLDGETKSGIIKNMKAIVIQNIGGYFVNGTDNIIISSFVNVTAVGLYSNYSMLIDIGRTFINQIFYNIYHSVGNLVARESKDKIYSVYKVTMLLNFWLYSFFAIILYVNIEPFIALWIGSGFLLSKSVLIILLIIFYERGMRNSISTVKTTAGIFHEDRYAPLCQAAVNLGLSLSLVQSIGIAGVFIGTITSALLVPFWITPYLVYKKVFHKPVRHYYRAYANFTVIGIAACLITNYISHFVSPSNLLHLAFRAIIGIIIPNTIYVMLFFKTDEFKYLQGIMTNTMGNLQKRVKRVPAQDLSSGNS